VRPSDGPLQPLHRARGLPQIDPPDALLAAARNVPGAHISAITSLVLPGAFDTAGPGPPQDAPAQPRRTPLVWAACNMPSMPGTVVMMLMTLDRGSSSRHLSFLLDQNGQFLQHPYAELDGTVDPVYEGHDLFQECQSISAKKAWGRGASEQQAQTQRSDRPRSWPLQQPLLFLEGRLDAETHARLVSQMDKDRTDVLRWTEDIRTKLEQRGVPFGGASAGTNVVRLLARTPLDLESARSTADRAYRDRLNDGKEAVRWKTPVELKNGAVQFTRFYLREPQFDGAASAGTDPAYYFAYAAFREELASSIEQEMQTLRRVALALALLASLAAFGAAFYFVRPLSRIAETAKSVTKHGDDVSQLQLQIERLRNALPVLRTDETGDVARALESLLRQILNSHEQLRQLNADLDNRVREQTSELREANEQLRGLAAAKDAFLASVSHELRQPLNSIFGFLQFLEISHLDSEQQHDLGKLRSAATYLRRLIDDILDYQKIIMGGVELDPEDIDAAAFLTSMRETMMPQAQERKNQLALDVSKDLGIIHNDRARLQQVVTNLVSNACKFTQAGTVTLAARREKDATGKDWLILDVSDTGRGMKPEEMHGLFVRFKKLSAREGNKTGTGLGLVISKGLCELMGGDIGCRSEFGKGTTFTVRVPAIVADRGEVAPRRMTLDHPPALPLPAKPKVDTTVLVIDDDAAVRELMTRFLEGKGYHVLTAEDGAKGFELAKKHLPSVITLDVVLPGAQSGWDVLTQLKHDPETVDIPVVIVTFLEEPRHGFALGASDYIVKPIAWDSLLTSLQRITRNNGSSSPVLVVDDDADVRELFRRTLAKENMTTIEASNGAEALQQLRTQKPSLILLDLMMPVMDGFEFIAEFHCHPEWSDIPVVVVTAKHITREDRERLAVSARTVIEKSGFTQEVLLDRVLELVHQHSQAKTP
jgi:signal transduction histidine kinase/DNA-binding response OmpR family regulator